MKFLKMKNLHGDMNDLKRLIHLFALHLQAMLKIIFNAFTPILQGKKYTYTQHITPNNLIKVILKQSSGIICASVLYFSSLRCILLVHWLMNWEVRENDNWLFTELRSCSVGTVFQKVDVNVWWVAWFYHSQRKNI